MRNVFVFAGQGNQYYNMGKILLSSNPIFAEWMKTADNLMQKHQGRSFLDSLYCDSKSLLDDFALSHPALFAVQYAAAMSVEKPIDFVIGASLGEYIAMTIAGALSFEEAFCHILAQVDLFQKVLPRGKMVAVLESKEKIEAALAGVDYEIAAVSGQEHHTLTTLCEIQTNLVSNACLHLVLPVNYPFHSKWIDSGKALFLEEASKLKISPLCIPFGSCTSLQTHKHLTTNDLWNALRGPIKTQDALRLFLQDDDQIFDCSPTGTTKGLLRSIFGNRHQVQTLMSPYQLVNK